MQEGFTGLVGPGLAAAADVGAASPVAGRVRQRLSWADVVLPSWLRMGSPAASPDAVCLSPAASPIITPMTSVIDRSLLARDEHRQQVLKQLAAAGDASVSVPDLAFAVGVAPSSAREIVRDLMGQGLVVRVGGARSPVRITSEGRHRLAGDGPEAARLGPLLRMLPCEAYRAMLRLMLAAVIARHHLRRRLPDAPWPSFVAVGGTGDGKTMLARTVCRLLGLSGASHIPVVSRLARGELVGRREQQAGREGWRVHRPALFAAPFVCLDEWDKAELDVQRAAMTLMQGDALVKLEGELVDVAPVLYATGNLSYQQLCVQMGEAYVGRAVVLDSRGLAGLLDNVDLAARDLLAPYALPRLRLDELVPPAEALPAIWFGWLRDALKGEPVPGCRLLTDRGRRLVRVEALALLPLGLAALYPVDTDPESRLAMATGQVLLDYLTVASTVDGHVAEEWTGLCSPVREWLRELGAAPIVGLPELASAAAERVRQAKVARQRRVARDAEDDELTRRRAMLVALCEEGWHAVDPRRTRTWPGPARIEAQGVRAVLGKLRRQAANAKTDQALADVTERTRAPLAEVDRLRALAAQHREQAATLRARAEEERRQAQAEKRSAHAIAAQHRRMAVAAARSDLTRVRARCRDLEKRLGRTTTRPGEAVPAALVELGAVQPRTVMHEAVTPLWPGQRAIARAIGRPEPLPRTRTERVTFLVDITGARYTAAELATWEAPGTKAALSAALAQLHAAEDHLVAVAGSPSRNARPQIGAATARRALPAGTML